MKEMVGGCCVCSDERGWTENPLVYCDGGGCNVAVHQACYGIVEVPKGPWFCRKCESQERQARVKCDLCPSKDGALKRTDTNGWCHVVCALFIPEAWFGNVQTMEPIILRLVPAERFNKIGGSCGKSIKEHEIWDSLQGPTLTFAATCPVGQTCYVCEENQRDGRSSTGACMQCNKAGCKTHFHVTCAQAQGLLCEEAGNEEDNVKYCGYCSYHYKKLKRDSHIKTIPAYKPIPADNATPDATPEKRIDFKEKNRLREKERYERSLSAGDYANQVGTVGLDTSKFTTANFRETTVTLSRVDLSDIDTQKRQVRKPGAMKNAGCVLPSDIDRKSEIDIDAQSSTSIASTISTTSVQSELGGESKKKDLRVSSSANSSSLSQDEGPIVTASTSVAMTTNHSNAPAAATTGGGTSAADGNKSFSSTFETFLRSYPDAPPPPAPSSTGNASCPSPAGSIPSTATGASTGNTTSTPPPLSSTPGGVDTKPALSPTPPPIMGATSPTTSPPSSGGTGKRQRSSSAEKGVGRKKQKKQKQLGTPLSRAKTVKEYLAQTVDGPAPPAAASASSLPVSPPASPTKKVGGKKKKQVDTSTPLASPVTSASPTFSPPFSSAPYTQSLASSAPVSLTSLQKSGLGSEPPKLDLSFENGPSNGSNSSSSITNLGNLIGPLKPRRDGASGSAGGSTVSSLGGSIMGGGGDNNSASLPSTMEQLLERQWEQGSQFLMEQGQHFDIASLLNCLHQLRAENQRLEEHIQSLLSRRDHLLAVNARLSLPLTPVNNPHAPAAPPTPHSNTASSHTATPPEEGGATSRSPRINNYLPSEGSSSNQQQREHASQDLISSIGRSISRSPGQATPSPAHNHLPAGPSSISSQSPGGLNSSHGGGGGHNTSGGSQTPEGRQRMTTTPNMTGASPAHHHHHTPPEQQQQQREPQQPQQRPPGMPPIPHHLTMEQHQRLMFHMMQQHQQQSAFSQAPPTSHHQNLASSRQAGPGMTPISQATASASSSSRSGKQPTDKNKES